MTSILLTIKKLLGIPNSDAFFDEDIIIHINSVFSILTQLGVGPESGFSITSESEQWTDFLPAGKALEDVKSYVYLKVRTMFDPPSSSFVLESVNKLCSEYEWRINVEAERENV